MQPTIKQLRARAAEYGMEIEQVCERVKRDDDGTPREPKWELHAPRGKAFRDGPRSYVSADLEQLKADIDDAIIDGFENA